MSLKNNDLVNNLLPDVSIDEFEPKAGNERDVIVVAFYLKDKDPAADLNTFIQRSFVDTLDIEVSPSTDEEGRYLVFVEMNRDETFPKKLQALLRDVENLSNDIDWNIRTYYSGNQSFSVDDPALLSFLILNPEDYTTKDKFKGTKMKEGIEEFLQNSFVQKLTISGDSVIMSNNSHSVIAEVVDVGDYDRVIGRNFLAEAAFNLSQIPYEAKVLESILGNCQVVPLGSYLCVGNNDKIMLLQKTQINYKD